VAMSEADLCDLSHAAARAQAHSPAAPFDRGTIGHSLSTAPTLLPTLSTSRQATVSQAATTSTVSRAPDPRRHSVVCCCCLCEQRGTGEQAMRLVGGDYQRFLARLARR